MADEDVLNPIALGDETALLQTQALANVASDIRPDPPAPAPAPTPRAPRAPRALETTKASEKDLEWKPDAISVVVQTPDGRAFGHAALGGGRGRLSDQVALSVKRGDPAGFWVVVRFFVDDTNRSRRPPFTPPQVGVAWKFRPDGGDWGSVTHLFDPSPIYVAPGFPLRTNFSESVGVPAAASGWFAISGRIEDAAGAVEYDDFLRCIATD